MIAPHRSNRVRRNSRDGRRPPRFERRWIVDRFSAWIKWQRRLFVRREYGRASSLDFVRLASQCILLKRY